LRNNETLRPRDFDKQEANKYARGSESRDSVARDKCTGIGSHISIFRRPDPAQGGRKNVDSVNERELAIFIFQPLALVQSCAVLRASPCTARSTVSLGETQIGYWISRATSVPRREGCFFVSRTIIRGYVIINWPVIISPTTERRSLWVFVLRAYPCNHRNTLHRFTCEDGLQMCMCVCRVRSLLGRMAISLMGLRVEIASLNYYVDNERVRNDMNRVIRC